VSIEDAYAAALESTPRLPRDGAAVQLGLRYAEALDEMFARLANDADTIEDPATHARVILEITRIGGRFEATLDRLGMTPGARPAATLGGAGGPTAEGAALDALRRDAASGAPASGVDYTAAVDPAVADADAED
jgi:hypothetical protein